MNTALAGLKYTPLTDFVGTETMKISVSDGDLSSSALVSIIISPEPLINVAPVITAPATVVIAPDNAFVFETINTITVSDNVPSSSVETVTLTSSVGTLKLSSTAGLLFASGADSSSQMSVTGSLDLLNAALVGLTFTPPFTYSGPVSITVGVNDLGNIGIPGPLSSSKTIDLTVTVPNYPPVISAPQSATTQEDTPFSFDSADAITISNLLSTSTDVFEVSLTTSNSVLSLSSLSGLTFTNGDGLFDSGITFSQSCKYQ